MAAGASASSTNSDTMRVVSREPASFLRSSRVSDQAFTTTSPNRMMEPIVLMTSSQEYISPSCEDSWVALLISCSDNSTKPNRMTMETLTGSFIFE